jgi:uncharacterized repeat protein (TIGR01451 family)
LRPDDAIRTPARLAQVPFRSRGRIGRFGKALVCLCLALSLSPAGWADTTPPPTPPGTIIHNNPVLTWDGLQGTPDTGPTDAGVVTKIVDTQTPVIAPRTPSTVGFLTWAPGSALLLAGPTGCSSDGTTFNPLPAPVSAQGHTLDPTQPQPLGPAQMYYPGDPVFISVTDRDQNINANLRENVLANVSVSGSNQAVTVRLTETGTDTGIFTGYALTAKAGAATHACTLALGANQQLQLSYTDILDPSDTSIAHAQVDPYNVVFDSITGKPIDNARIALVDADSGAAAQVTGRDGISSFPSTVTSGQDATDSSGAAYSATAGSFLLPQVAPGHYRLQVTPPPGYRYASTVQTAALQALPGAPYALGPASFGKAFVLDKSQPVGFDIPLDPVSTGLFVQKTASATSAAVGDMLQFTVTVENTDKSLTAQGVYVLDTLPQGFRYVHGSARLGSARAADPTIAADAQQLRFDIGVLAPSTQAQLTYVVEVAAATPLGTAVNRAQGFGEGGATSNIATAQVQIQNELMQDVNTIIGRVLIGCGKDAKGTPQGLAGARVLLETGDYAVADKDGRFHFEAVKNGTHVLQLDKDSLPAGYAVASCENNTRFAGRSYSQFIELHGGALWRADFHVQPLPAPTGAVTVQLAQQATGGQMDTTVRLGIEQVPVNALSVTVLPPDGAVFVKGSASLDGSKLADVEAMGGALVFRLGERAAGWHGLLRFGLRPAPGGSVGAATTVLANFDTPSAARQHTPPTTLAWPVGGPAQSATQRLATLGIAPVERAKAVAAEAAASAKAAAVNDDFALDTKWLATATPAAAWVWPHQDWLPTVPAIKVAVKHGPRQRARLSVNGAPVSSRNFLGVTGNAGHTAAVSQWLGVPLREGDNALVAEILQGDKVVQRLTRNVHYSGSPVRVEVVASKSTLIADGKSRPRLAIRLYDRWGYPVRRGMTGRYTMQAPYQPYQSIEQLQSRQLLATTPREPSYTVGADGIAWIVLAPTSVSGEVVVDIPLQTQTPQELRAWLKPGNRDWILVGLATGSATLNGIQGHIQTLSGDNPDRDIVQDGRVAFYAKGMVKGKYLLTAAYDTARSGGVDRNGVQQNGSGQGVDPNQYFMLYGDASERGQDAVSASKLYVKIERGQFYAMFGDFDTGLSVTELSRYERRFNGAKSAYEGKHFKYTAFAARNAQSYARDEIEGDGTSGLYHLAAHDILLNSERIRIEVRDRYHSQTVISSQPLTRYLDYTIDYLTGALFFKQPVPSRDENFNPVYIVAEYETMRPGAQSITAGGRAALKLAGDKLEIGVTAVNEGSSAGANRLLGTDLRWDLATGTELKAELAHTANGGAGVGSLLTGTNRALGSTRTSNRSNQSGNAWLVTLQNHGKNLQSEVYLRQQDAGFGLGQQALSETGTRKLGGNADYRLGKYWSLHGEAYREQSLLDAGARTAVDGSASYQGSGWSFNAGARHVQDQYLISTATATTATATDAAAGKGATDQVYVGGAVSLFSGKLTLHGTTNQNVGGSKDPAYPATSTVGVDYKLNDKATLFLNQQLASGGDTRQASSMTELGVKSTPWSRAQLTSSLAQQMTEYGPRTFSTMGLTQGWQVGKALTLTAGLSRAASLKRPSAPVDDGGAVVAVGGTPVIDTAVPSPTANATEDFTSMFVGGTWRKQDWSWTMRAETLNSESEQRHGLFGGFYRDLSGGDALSSSLQAFDSSFKYGGASTDVTARFGFVHRPDGTRWSLLEQLDLVYANQQGLGLSPFLQQGSTGIAASQQSPDQLAAAQGTTGTFGIDQRTAKLVNNLQLNYRGDDSQWSVYYGSKFARYTFDSGVYQGYTDLIGSEYRHDLSERWDIGIVGNRMYSWRSHVASYGFGVETGWDIATNMWLSVGYNIKGFHDQDFTAAHYTARGVYLRFRMKFDQDTVREMAEGGGR